MPTLKIDRYTGPNQNDDNEAIRERNGIWVVTINGIWRGDYTQREFAVAAVNAAQQNAPYKQR